jgi:hypothetical protein
MKYSSQVRYVVLFFAAAAGVTAAFEDDVSDTKGKDPAEGVCSHSDVKEDRPGAGVTNEASVFSITAAAPLSLRPSNEDSSELAPENLVLLARGVSEQSLSKFPSDRVLLSLP